MNNLDNLQMEIGYQFNDTSLLETAMTHISYAKENNVESYERLEFLGDAVLEMVVTDAIYKNYSLPAGQSSKLRASLVSTENLCNIANNLGLHNNIKKSKSLPQISKKTTADLFESLLGAVYLDGGIGIVNKMIDRFVIIDKNNLDIHLNSCEDAKTSLQELLQAVGQTFEYKLIKSSGMDHNKTFEVELIIDGKSVSRGSSNSIQSAEELAASQYLKSIK